MAGERLLQQGENRREAIMGFLRTYINEHDGMAPTIQEIADGVGLVSPNATRSHLVRLEQDGLIKMRPRVARGITLVKKRGRRVDSS